MPDIERCGASFTIKRTNPTMGEAMVDAIYFKDTLGISFYAVHIPQEDGTIESEINGYCRRRSSGEHCIGLCV